MKNVEISDHAAEQFVAKTKSKKGKAEAKRKITDMVNAATSIKLKAGYRANNVLLNGYRESKFRRFADWIFVLDELEKVVITCYPSNGYKWVNV